MNPLPAVLMLCVAATLAAPREVTTRRNLRPNPEAYTTPHADSIADPTPEVIILNPGDVEVFGYAKPLSAVREAMFVRNNLPDSIADLSLRITYLSTDGHNIHSREVTLPGSIPPGDTRRFEIPAWDRLKTLYHTSTPPARPRPSAIPYSVKITPLSAMTRPEKC